MSPLELITFDITGTLLTFTAPVIQQYARIASRHNIHPQPESLAANFKQSWKTLSAHHPNFGKHTGLGWQNWWRSIVFQTFKDSLQEQHTLNLIADDLIKHFETDEAWCVSEGGTDLLKSLKERNLILGVISNFDPRLHTIINNLQLAGYFSFVLTSYEAGFEKPDRRIFEKALEMGGARRLVHVGNDRERDFNGARSAGFQAVLLDSEDRARDLEFPLRVCSLRSVAACLEFYNRK